MNTVFPGNKTLLMGIVNITPDSFSDGGLYNNVEGAVKHTEAMLAEGADIIDIGGESTRPGSKKVSAKEEKERVIPVISAIRKQLGRDFLISIDTNKAEVADAALFAGADFINSLGGFLFDEHLADIAGKYNCKVVIYHIKGIPETMQRGEIIYDDVIQEISDFFEKQISLAEKHGLKRDRLILDPGIGFGKTVEQNVEIIRRLGAFKKFNLPILIGVSRKSHLGSLLAKELGKDFPPLERLEGALAETAAAILNGAQIIRTHDILQTKKFITVMDEIKHG